MLPETLPPNEVQKTSSTQTSAVQSKLADLPDTIAVSLASLDHSSALLYEALENLKAAKSVDMAEVEGHLRAAPAKSADAVRQFVQSECPQASWQNRDELNELIAKIQQILEARTLAQQRSTRLLALATELERGSIVHRRVQRLNELNQLREQAINELRSLAGVEGAPSSLPGPDSDQWMEWACGLQEPQDAESLQALRTGFPHLDDFVANIEFSMWVAAKTLTSKGPPGPDGAGDGSYAEPSRPDGGSSAEPIASSGSMRTSMEEVDSSGDCGVPRFPELLSRSPLPSHESSTLTPNDASPPHTEEASQRIQEQEQALLASMMDLVSDPSGHFNPASERPFTAAFLRDNRPPSPTAGGMDDGSNPPAEAPSPTKVAPDTNAAAAVTPNRKTGVERVWNGKWLMLLAIVALLTFVGVEITMSRSHTIHASSAPVGAIENKVPDQARGNTHPQPLVSPVSETRSSSPKPPAEKQSKPPSQSVASKSNSKPSPAKQASNPEAGGSSSPGATPTNVAMVTKESSPKSTAEMPGPIPGALPVGTSNGLANVARDVPVPEPKLGNNLPAAGPKVASAVPLAEPKAADQQIRVSSGVAEGLLVHQVTPVYPPMAWQLRIQGTVVLAAVIAKDGTVKSLRVVSGHPMLTQAAMEAVRQWRYKPYRLDGEPVEANTQIHVNFTR